MSSRRRSRPSGRIRLSTDPIPGTPSPDAPFDAGPDPHARRPSIDERRARREELDASGRDRYDSLLRHLQAGRQLPLEPRASRRLPRLDVHRVGLRILAIAAVVAALWIGAIVVNDRLREGQIDAWSGPDATVRSGASLAGCDLGAPPVDTVFPGWIVYEGRVYRWADLSAPITDSSIPDSYLPTDYRLGDLRLYLIESSQSGRDLERILVRNGTANAGAVYLWAPQCSAPA